MRAMCLRTREPTEVPVHMLPMKTPRLGRLLVSGHVEVLTRKKGAVWSARPFRAVVSWIGFAAWVRQRQRTGYNDLMFCHCVLDDGLFDELDQPLAHTFHHAHEGCTVGATLHNACACV